MDKKPGNLIGAVVLIFVQAAFSLFAGVLGMLDITERMDHGQKVTPAHYLFGYGTFVVGVVLAVCAVLLLRRVGAARIPVAVLEGLNILGGLFSLTQGAPAAIVGIVLAVIVLVVMFSRQTSDWLSARTTV
jgi:hypothetical protein